jgi:transcriptional regulator with XRE-family HTH domain
VAGSGWSRGSTPRAPCHYPEFFENDDARAALAARDIGTLYRLLQRLGVTQREIARLTGQSQPEVNDILKGRKVRDVWVLERITDGLGIPRARMGLSYGEQGPDSPSAEEVDEAMKRRAALATTSAVVLGEAFLGLDELTELALPTGQALPSRLGISHVHALRAVTEQLRGVARYYGGQADVISATATFYTRWLQVPATEAVTAQFRAALAALHTEAGWYCYDSGVDGTGHFTQALRIAGKAGDVYGVANAAWHAGATMIHSGHPNDALKLFQLGKFHLRRLTAGKSRPATPRTEDPRVPTIIARLNRQSATAYAFMGGLDEATRSLTQAHEGWEPHETYEHGESDLETAVIQLHLGQLDVAERFATSAVRNYGQSHRVGHTMAELLLAEIHIRAEEPQGLTLARQAIDGARTLQSVAAHRERLMPLAAALETRPGTDTRELARTARQIATTRT